MPVDVSFYGRPPPDPMSAVGSAVGLANGLVQNKIAQQELSSRQAIGNAFQSAINPDGSVDPTRLGNALASDPAAAFGAPEAFQRAASLQGQNISNINAAAAGAQGQTGDAVSAMSSIAANPNASRADLVAEANARLHNGLLSGPAYHALVDNMPPDNRGAVGYVKTKLAGMLTPTQQASPMAAGVNPDLTPKMVPGIAAVKMAQQPGGYAGAATPGAVEVAASDKKALFEDQLAASNTMGQLRPLQQALPLLQQLSHSDFGPGSPQLAQLKGILDTIGITDPNSTSLPTRQDANKLLSQYVNQSRTAERSDAALGQQIKASPNLDLTQPANLALVKNQIGLDQMSAAMPKAYALDAKPGQTYSEFKNNYYQSYDPRAFGFGNLTPEERSSVRTSLGPKVDKSGNLTPQWQKFMHSVDIAKGTGMLPPPVAQPAAAGAQ